MTIRNNCDNNITITEKNNKSFTLKTYVFVAPWRAVDVDNKKCIIFKI